MTSPEPGSRTVLRVVVADDCEAVRARIIDLVTRLDHVEVVAAAADAPAAVEAVRRHRPDVLVLDVNMPGGGGLTALPKVTAAHPSTAVVMLSNQVHPLYRHTCLRAGARYFLDKSREFEQLHHVLEELAARPEMQG